MITMDDFLKLDIRVGTIMDAKVNEKAKKPAYILWVNFGEEIGIKASSAQLCQNYSLEDLMGRQVLGVMNFPPRRIAGFKSEVLILGAMDEKKGTVLIKPDSQTLNGSPLG